MVNMNNSKGNYCFLGVAIAYFIIAGLQWHAEGLLPEWLYVMIAFASLSISAFEALKVTVKCYECSCIKYIEIKEHYNMQAQKHIKIFKTYKSLSKENYEYESLLISDKDRESIKKYKKNVDFANQLLEIISCLEIIFVTVMILITPLKIVPYDLITTKTINVVTIIAFGVVFLTGFINNIYDETRDKMESLLTIEDNNMNYYLGIIEKISSEVSEDSFPGKTGS